ncbi:hypothetical protein MTO96_034761 [Rhipicephalus appendiculatus]
MIRNPPVCFHCGGRGHYKSQCPSRPPGKRPGPAMVSSYQSPANILPGPGVLSLYAGTGTPAATPPWVTVRLREQPGVPQRARRRVFCSSHHPAARKQCRGKPSTKQLTPKGRKPHPFHSDNCQRNKQPTLLQIGPRTITATVYSTIR